MKLENYVWKSDFAREHQAFGEARGEAKSVLKVLRTRMICVPDEARARILGCNDREQLDLWLERALTVDTLDELFA